MTPACDLYKHFLAVSPPPHSLADTGRSEGIRVVHFPLPSEKVERNSVGHFCCHRSIRFLQNGFLSREVFVKENTMPWAYFRKVTFVIPLPEAAEICL